MLPTLKFSFERWKFNSNYGLYVSTEGRVKDKDKKFLKIYTSTKSYLCVKYFDEKYGVLKTIFLHRLVLSTWRPREDMESMTVDHLDHNKRNNSLSNLEWVTRKENLERAEEDRISNREADILVCKEMLRGVNEISFSKNKRVICFKNLEEAINTLAAFNPNILTDIAEAEFKIVNSIQHKTKCFGGTWRLKY